MTRYPLYIAFLCMLVSPMLYVPTLLLHARYHGSITAIGIAMLIGVLLTFLFRRSLNQFHDVPLIEILEKNLPIPIRVFIFCLFGLTWIAAGTSVLISISFIINRFVNPTMDLHVLFLCFLIACSWAALRSTTAILYILEIWLLITTPVIIFIWIKCIRNETFSWDAVLTMSDYVLKAPTWDLIAVGSFLFTGYISLSICQMHDAQKVRIHWIWSVPLMGCIVFSALFILPIGIHGTQAVDQYVYIWVNTADSIQLKYGVIERGVFLYLISYIIISMLFIVLSWHVALQWINRSMTSHPKHLKRFLLGILGIAVFLSGYFISEKQVMNLTHSWLSLRFIAELLLVLILMGVGRKIRHA